MTQTGPLAARATLVTGAASGIGAATARRLAALGSHVGLLARRRDRLESLAEEIRAAGGDATPVPADVTDAASVAAALDAFAAGAGDVSVLVNAAGLMLAAPFDEQPADDWERMLATNLGGTLNVTRAALPGLRRSAAAGRGADVVNISSIGAHVVFPAYGVYAATKAAVTQLSANLRADLAPHGVRVTNIEPGLTGTELGTHLDDTRRTQLASMFDVIEALEADDVADVVAYAVTRPARVNLRQLVVLPSTQV